MNYFILAENSFLKLIKERTGEDPETAYSNFIAQVIDLCKHADNSYKAVALLLVETELHFIKSQSDEVNLYVRKALLFVRKILRLITQGKTIEFTQETDKRPSGLRWTGQNTDFVELVYGLHTKKCINDGDVSLKDMLTTFMQFLDFEKPLANSYITYRDVKMRKLDNRATFLQYMTNVHNCRMRGDDRKQQGDR